MREQRPIVFLGVGAAPDEHALRDALPDGRRRQFRAGLRCRDGQYAHARGLRGRSARTSAACSPTSSSASTSKTSGWTRCSNRKHRTPELAAGWVAARPELMRRWLAGVHAFDGSPALAPWQPQGPRPKTSRFEAWVTRTQDSGRRSGHDGRSSTQRQHARGFFDGDFGCRSGQHAAVRYRAARAFRHRVLIGGIALAGLVRCAVRSALAVFVVLALLFIMNQGYWDGDARDADAGARRGARCDGDRRAARHRGGATAAALRRAAAGARPDADLADVRLSHADARAVRPRCRAGPDLDDDLRVAGADPADATRHLFGAEDAASRPARPSARRRCSCCRRSNCRAPRRRSSPASRNASC